jgi:hypothetical protein
MSGFHPLLTLAAGKGPQRKRLHSQTVENVMEIDSEEQSSERAELHFLAALVDELMKALLMKGVMDRSQLQAVENAVSERIGTEPRNW